MRFFLHHANIDRLWAKWQETHGVDTYEPVSGYVHNNVDDAMRPFDEAGIFATPASIADVTELGYGYQDPGSSGVITASGAKQPTGASRLGAVSSPTRLWCRIAERPGVL